MTNVPQLLVTLAIARRDHRVMHSSRRILGEGQHRATPIAVQCVSGSKVQPQYRSTAVLHVHELLIFTRN